jgi:hypothetical protein
MMLRQAGRSFLKNQLFTMRKVVYNIGWQDNFKA